MARFETLKVYVKLEPGNVIFLVDRRICIGSQILFD